MNKARLLLTAGLMTGLCAAGNAAATAASDQAAHPGWRTAKADDGRTVPVRSHASWSRAYARTGEGRIGYYGGDHGYGAYGAGWDYPGWSHGGDLADAALGLVALGALGAADYPYGYGYGYPGARYAYGCVRTQWDPGVGYVRVRAPC